MLAETICCAVSAVGLLAAAVTAYRGRFLAATRVAAYALVPLGLVLTGTVGWLAGTVLSPVAWAGFGMLGTAWLLFAGTRVVERRRGARRRPLPPGAQRPDAPAVGAARPAPGAGRGRADGGAPADEFGEIEAILKKHGI